jgi:hypothetical protein
MSMPKALSGTLSFNIRMSNDGGATLDALPEDELSADRIQQLVTQFESSSTEAIRNIHLHAHAGLKNAGPALRQAGILPLLVSELSQHTHETHGPHDDDTSIRAMAADILSAITTSDVSSADLLIRLDIVKTICCMGCIDSHSLGKGMTLTAASLQLLLVLIRRLTPGAREHLYDQLFSFGAISKICALLDWPLASQVSARIMGWVTGAAQFRERLRDLGQIPTLVTSCRHNNQR